MLAAWALVRGHEGWAFTATTITIGLSIVTIFVDLYPRVMVSSTNPAYSLTVHNSASPPYSLKVTTVVTLVLLPIVLAYQAWTYYVFRRRITDQSFRPSRPPRGPRYPRRSPWRASQASGRGGDRHRRQGPATQPVAR